MLEINRKLVSKTLIQCCRERLMDIVLSWYVVLTIFCIVCLEEVARGLDDVSNNRLKCEDVPGMRPRPSVELFMKQTIL